MNDQPILIHGDNHGSWDRLFKKIEDADITDCILIGVGDTGIGFKTNEKQLREIELLNNRFKKRNIQYMSIRGNHDDPTYFFGTVKLSNFELIPDYTYRELNGETFLFVGGAISIDRKMRTLNSTYWRDEVFVLKPELVKKCDVLIAHTAPYWVGPFDKEGLSGWCIKDVHLWDECEKERKDLDELVKLCQPSRSYHGHFHTSAWVDFRECFARILDIDEIVEHKQISRMTAS
jgi:Icc-related predicted phosphoesterase